MGHAGNERSCCIEAELDRCCRASNGAQRLSAKKVGEYDSTASNYHPKGSAAVRREGKSHFDASHIKQYHHANRGANEPNDHRSPRAYPGVEDALEEPAGASKHGEIAEHDRRVLWRQPSVNKVRYLMQVDSAPAHC